MFGAPWKIVSATPEPSARWVRGAGSWVSTSPGSGFAFELVCLTELTSKPRLRSVSRAASSCRPRTSGIAAVTGAATTSSTIVPIGVRVPSGGLCSSTVPASSPARRSICGRMRPITSLRSSTAATASSCARAR